MDGDRDGPSCGVTAVAPAAAEPARPFPWPLSLAVGLASLASGLAMLVLLARPPMATVDGHGATAASDAPPVQLREPAPLPEFALIERSGRAVTRADWLGTVHIVGFIFTRCHQTCPMVTSAMAELQRGLPPGVRLVSLTVDPRHDRPGVLADYAKIHGAGEAWWFLTGERDPVVALIENGFGVAVRENPDPRTIPGELVSHTTRLALVDKQARLVSYHSARDPGALAALRSKAERLTRD